MGVGVFLPVEVVQQAGEVPFMGFLVVFVQLLGVGRHGGSNHAAVVSQVFVFDEGFEQLFSFLFRHGSSKLLFFKGKVKITGSPGFERIYQLLKGMQEKHKKSDFSRIFRGWLPLPVVKDQKEQLVSFYSFQIMLPIYLKKSRVSAAACVAPEGQLIDCNPAFERLFGEKTGFTKLFDLIQTGSHGSLRRLCANAGSAEKRRKRTIPVTTLFTVYGTAVQADFMPFSEGPEGTVLLGLFAQILPNTGLPKHTPTNLELQRDYLASIIAAIPDMLLIADRDGNILEWGHAADGKEGFVPAAGFEETALQGLLPVRVRAAFRSALRRICRGESAERVEYSLAGSGQDNWFEANLAPLGNDKIIVLNRDITKRKQTEEKIRIQEGMLRAIYNSAGQSVTFIDLEFKVMFFNKVAENIVKQVFGKVKTIGAPALDYVLPADRDAFENYYREALAGKQAYFEKENQGKWWRFFIYPVYDEGGKISGIAQNVADVTDRKEREIELRENKERLNKTIEAVPHPLLITDEACCITYINEQFEAVLGYDESKAVGLPLSSLIPDDYKAEFGQKPLLYFERVETENALSTDRYIAVLRSCGDQITMDSSFNTFSNFGKQYSIIILQDVTELKRRQDIILTQNKFLRKIAWQQSHEVRRPIANILGICNMIRGDEALSNEELKLYLQHLSIEVANLDDIVKAIVAETNRTEEAAGDQPGT